MIQERDLRQSFQRYIFVTLNKFFFFLTIVNLSMYVVVRCKKI